MEDLVSTPVESWLVTTIDAEILGLEIGGIAPAVLIVSGWKKEYFFDARSIYTFKSDLKVQNISLNMNNSYTIKSKNR